MPQISLHGMSLGLRADGQLTNLNDWNIDVARELARNENIELTDAHWEIINLIRQYYETYNIAPIMKLLKKEMVEYHGPEKANDNYLTSLFPNGASMQGAKIAGVPIPVLDAELDKSAYLKSTSIHHDHSITFREFDYDGKTYKVYAKGNLVHPEEWNEALAEHMAGLEDITLTSAHWEVLKFLRQFYFQYGITPMVKLLQKHMLKVMGEEKCSETYLYRLFPAGPARQGSRIAGLPEPQGCIDP